MKYLSLLAVLFFIGCKERKDKMVKLGTYSIYVYKNETLQDAIMRLDSGGTELVFRSKTSSGTPRDSWDTVPLTTSSDNSPIYLGSEGQGKKIEINHKERFQYGNYVKSEILIIGDKGNVLARKDFTTREWEIFDCKAALEMWYKMDSIRISKK